MQFRTQYGIIWKSASQKGSAKKMMVTNVGGSVEYISEEIPSKRERESNK